ncbi:hypothetical protein [Pantoea agglomerans]|uniref:hypothetical protein n=1 Tax=Enterobacter agglomerans TaxID=549 RepID=UPI00320B1CBA
MKKIILCGVILLIACLVLPAGIYAWSFREHNISINTSDWGNFGSYLSGTGGLLSALSFAGLIATLIITIKNNTETSKLAQTSLKEARDNFEEQFNLQKEANSFEKKMREREYNSIYFKMLLDSLNSKLDNKVYNVYSPHFNNDFIYSESEFLNEAFTFYDNVLHTDAFTNENILEDNKNYLISNILDCGIILDHYLNIKYPEEITILIKLIEIINRSDSEDIKNDLIDQFHAGTYRDRTFWLLIYSFDNLDLMKEFFFQYPQIMALPQHMMENPPPLHTSS